jgi:Domain of unknown function (DUF1814).
VVYGLEKFKEYFEDYTNHYVLIGGTACDILMDEIGRHFRATKDLDIVLIVEVLDYSFGEVFWQFIADGEYKYREKGTGEKQFYRFTEPVNENFPKMIELFSRIPDNLELHFEGRITPIHIDDSIKSLSAILLNDDYYNLLLEGRRIVNGYSVIKIETTILFKIKAWLDMRKRKEMGEQIDSRSIKKHMNDVFRLLSIVNPSSKCFLVEEIKKDVTQFLQQIKDDSPILKDLGIKGINLNEMLKSLEEIFLVEEAPQ